MQMRRKYLPVKEEKLRIQKLHALNTKYQHVRNKSLILAAPFIILFFLLFFLLPFKWNSLSMYVIGIYCFLQPIFIKKHFEYYNERAKLIPGSHKLTTVYIYHIIAGIVVITIGTIFLVIELFFPHTTNSEPFSNINNIHFYSVIILIIFMFTVKYIQIKYQIYSDLDTIEALDSRLKQKSTNCPKCGHLSEQGYLRSIRIRWHEPGVKKFVWPLFSRSQHAVPSNICRKCNVIFGQYTISSKTVDCIRSKPDTSDPYHCPHCSSPLKSGTMLSDWAFAWSENPYGILLFDRKKHFVSTAFPIQNQHLPTKKCKNCGFFISIYDPKKFRRANCIGMAMYIITCTIALYVLYWVIPLMF